MQNLKIIKNLIKKLSSIFLILLAGVLVTAFAGCSKTSSKNTCTLKNGILQIGTEYGYPPFEYLAEDGTTLIGFDVDLWNELCRRLELKPVFYDTQWAGILDGLETHRYDCIISAITITPERKERFLITEPYVQNSECFVVNTNSAKSPVTDPALLNGKKIAYQAETVSDVYVNNLIANGARFKTFEYDKLLDAFDDLKFGRVDVVVAESVAAGVIVKNNKDIFRIDFVGEPDAYFGIIVAKDNPELFEKIQTTLNEMRADGFMAALEEKWLK